MGVVLIDEKGGWRIWSAPQLMAIPASLALAFLSLPAPRAGQVAGVIQTSAQGASAFVALLKIDPDLRWVDQQWGGRLIFVVSQKANFADLARSAGALMVFDAKSVGCSFPSENNKGLSSRYQSASD